MNNRRQTSNGMKKGISASALALLLTLPSFVLADFALAEIPTVSVPDSCAVTDTEGTLHTFGGQYLGICALAAAKEQNAISAYALQNFSFGLFLQSINGVIPGAMEFWSISLNGMEAAVGLSDLVIAQDDTLGFQLTDWSANITVGNPISFQITLLASAAKAPISSSGGGEFLEERHFNVESAFDFLVSKQRADGSFGSAMLTDWAAIAFGVSTDEVCNDACPVAREKLRTHVMSMVIATSTATDLERHIMALEALGIDPYTVPGSPVDALVAQFDGTQMGEPSLVNDDIFAIFPLLHAGYETSDPMIKAIGAFILAKQQLNGSWEGSIDLTAAAVQAIAQFLDQKSRDALVKAEEFLRRNQNESGIFGPNSFTLSWALQAIHALGQKPDEWKKGSLSPLAHLGVFQQDDGGMEPTVVSEQARIWATSYAIPAAFGKPWDDILKDFSRPVPAPEIAMMQATSSAMIETAQTEHETPQRPVVEAFKKKSEPFPLESFAASSLAVMSTTTPATTTSEHVAAAAISTNDQSSPWLWIAGLILVIGGSLYFVRNV